MMRQRMVLSLFILISAQSWAGESVLFRPASQIVDSQRILDCGGLWNAKTGLFQIPVEKLDCTELLNEGDSDLSTLKQASLPLQQLSSKLSSDAIEKFVQNMKQVQVLQSEKGTFESIVSKGVPRGWAVNLTKQRTVIVNGNPPTEGAQAVTNPYIYLHEYMGALGVNDRDYSLSSGVWAINNGQIPADQIQKIVQNLETEIQSAQPGMNIGKPGMNESTIIGQGGDITEMKFKMVLLKDISSAAFPLLQKGWKDQGFGLLSANEMREAVLQSQIAFLEADVLRKSSPRQVRGQVIYGGFAFNALKNYDVIILPDDFLSLSVNDFVAYRQLALDDTAFVLSCRKDRQCIKQLKGLELGTAPQ